MSAPVTELECVPVFDWTPHRLGSLLELHAYPLGIWAVLEFLDNTRRELESAINEGGRDFTLPSPKMVPNEDGVSVGNMTMVMGARINRAHDYATWLDMHASRQRAGEAKIALGIGSDGCIRKAVMAKTVAKHCEKLFDALKTDLATREFIYIPAVNAAYIRLEHSVDSSILAAFPSASLDAEQAQRALGFDMPNAACFHSCRILEVAIASLERFLGLTGPKKPGEKTWGALLGAIDKENESRKGSANFPNWKGSAEWQFIRTVHADIHAVMIAWRNPTMHVERNYTFREAETVFESIKLAMSSIAAHLDESGSFNP